MAESVAIAGLVLLAFLGALAGLAVAARRLMHRRTGSDAGSNGGGSPAWHADGDSGGDGSD